jgi:hypothetical protein
MAVFVHGKYAGYIHMSLQSAFRHSSGEGDPAEPRGDTRQVGAPPTGGGYVEVTLETALEHPDRDLVDRLRAHERIIDVTEGDKRMA